MGKETCINLGLNGCKLYQTVSVSCTNIYMYTDNITAAWNLISGYVNNNKTDATIMYVHNNTRQTEAGGRVSSSGVITLYNCIHMTGNDIFNPPLTTDHLVSELFGHGH